MLKSFKYAAAIVGVIVGAGFASGQEIMQFFTHFGWLGTVGALTATIMFAVIFMQIVQVGSELRTTSHRDVLYHMSGKKMGIVVDFIITFFLFGILVVMIAGSGSLFEQQFGVPSYVGNIVMAILTILTVLLNLEKIITIMGSFTPILIVMLLVILGYTVITTDISFSQIQEYSKLEAAAASNWVVGALLYVSYVTAAGFAMLAVMGGTSTDQKPARFGGLLGGALIGLLIIASHIAMLSNFEGIHELDMPMLLLASNISPAVGWLMAILILGMIYNTAIGMLYSFTVRFIDNEHPKFKLSIIGIGIAAFIASFVGFTNLVGTLYPITGYLGFLLIAVIILSFFRSKRMGEQTRKTIELTTKVSSK